MHVGHGFICFRQGITQTEVLSLTCGLNTWRTSVRETRPRASLDILAPWINVWFTTVFALSPVLPIRCVPFASLCWPYSVSERASNCAVVQFLLPTSDSQQRDQTTFSKQTLKGNWAPPMWDVGGTSAPRHWHARSSALTFFWILNWFLCSSRERSVTRQLHLCPCANMWRCGLWVTAEEQRRRECSQKLPPELL